MTPLTPEQEEALKEKYREIFYAGIAPRIAAASSEPLASVLDFVRGSHSLQDVIFGVPLTPSPKKPMIYPLRTYELIHELTQGDQR
jgi:hypothetical protein